MQLANFRPACVDHSETVHCMGCHPDVGAGYIRSICPALCDQWYHACKHDYYAVQGVANVPTPCLEDSLLCSKLSAFVSSGEQMCKLFGFAVALVGEKSCYDGKVDPNAVGEDDHANILDKMKEVFKSRPTKLWIALGASLLVGVVTIALFCSATEA